MRKTGAEFGDQRSAIRAVSVARCFSPRLQTLSSKARADAPRYSAFTVVELLVAAAITAVLAGLMLALVGNVLTGWNRSRGTLMTESQARIVLDQLAQDLQGAFYRNDGNVWLAATIESTLTGSAKPALGSLNLATASVTDAQCGVGGTFLRFFTTQVGGSPAAPEAVGYRIVYQAVSASSGAEKHYQLCRSEVLPAVTFNNGYEVNGTAYSSLGTPTPQQLIADNVIDFGVRFYMRELGQLGDGTKAEVLRVIFPAKPATPGATPANGTLSDGSASAELEHLATTSIFDATDYYRHTFPDVADIMVRVLTEEGVRQIQALENNQITGDWWTIALANSKVFTRRVELHPSPL